MEFSPQQVRSATFRTVKKGYDPGEVDAFKESVASSIEAAQSQAMAMEARARAAVAKLQELAAAPEPTREREPEPVAAVAAPAEPGASVSVSASDTETISRTLLLAQKTADATVADARLEASTLTGAARTEASNILDGARTMAGKLIEEAKAEARREAETERVRADGEVQALLARRDFLLSDVDHLEEYLSAQRERIRDAAVNLQDLVERVPGGLGDMRRPLLSASADDDNGDALEAAAEEATASAAARDDHAGDDHGHVEESDPEPTADAVADDAPPATITAEDTWRALDESGLTLPSNSSVENLKFSLDDKD